MFLWQAIGHDREILAIVHEILTIVEGLSPAAYVELQRLNAELRTALAQVTLEAEAARLRILTVIARLT